MLIDELLTYLFDNKPHILTDSMRTWLTSSRRFAAFVTTSRDKIRKKLRVTQDQETLYDLRLELETAYMLLRERALSLEYESEQSKQVRSPDFAVTYTTSVTFMVEVTRLRAIQQESAVSSNNGIPPAAERLADAICSKLRQLLPRRSNILVIGMDTMSLTQGDLQNLMLRIQQRAERDDPVFWRRYGFQERADFFRHYQRLSEVLVRSSQWKAGGPVAVWVNQQSKHPLPGKVRTVFYRSHTYNE